MSDERDLMDLVDASMEGETLTWKELADLLGVNVDYEGNIPGPELYNACLHVQTNPAVKALSRNDRVRAIRTAMYALEALRSGNL